MFMQSETNPEPISSGAPKKRGNPAMVEGQPSVNPAGRRSPLPEEPDDGVVTAAKMRKVFGQDPGMDKGPTERRLREMLKKDGTKFLLTLRDLEAEETGVSKMAGELAAARAEIAELKAELRSRDAKPVEDVDAGSERAKALIDRILAECDRR